MAPGCNVEGASEDLNEKGHNFDPGAAVKGNGAMSERETMREQWSTVTDTTREDVGDERQSTLSKRSCRRPPLEA